MIIETGYFSSVEPLDLRNLTWDSLDDQGSTTHGTFPKALISVDDTKYYLKLSRCDAFLNEIVGFESIFEVIVSRLLQALGIDHVEYTLHPATIQLSCSSTPIQTYLCISRDFRGTASKITAEQLFMMHGLQGETPLDTLHRVGYSENIDQMFLVDYLIYNRDRHGKNIEFCSEGNKVTWAPLFDNGFSLVSPYGLNLEAISKFDAMGDLPVNNFLGSNSLLRNLDFISRPIKVQGDSPFSRHELFMGLESTMPTIVQDKVWEILESRYTYVKDRKILVEG